MKEKVQALINEKKFSEIREEFRKLNNVEISDLLNKFDKSELIIIFRLLSKDQSADVFSYLEPEQQEIIINAVTDRETEVLFRNLYFDDMIDIIEEMPSNLVKKILKNTNSEDRYLINQFLNYPENSAGSIMTTEYVDLEKGMRVSDAISRIRKTGKDKDNIYTCYVTSEEGKLEGVISLKELIGKKVQAVLNLKPVELKGELSQGMLLTTTEKKKTKLVIINDEIKVGTTVK